MPYIKRFLKTANNEKAAIFLQNLGMSSAKAQRVIDKMRIYEEDRVVRQKNQLLNGKIYMVDYECHPKGLRPLFEDDNIAIFDKPSGVLAHPNGRDCLYSLYDEIWHLYGKEAAVAHRLDRETSGLIAVAKNRKYQNILKSLFESRAVCKSYLALVFGRVEEDFIIDCPIAKGDKNSFISIKMSVSSDGKEAITKIEPIGYFNNNNMTLVRAIPLTGRQHQIRVHLFHVKHPIVGDPLYGVSDELADRYLLGSLDMDERLKATGATRLCLHANWLKFQCNNKIYDIESKIDASDEFIRALVI